MKKKSESIVSNVKVKRFVKEDNFKPYAHIEFDVDLELTESLSNVAYEAKMIDGTKMDIDEMMTKELLHEMRRIDNENLTKGKYNECTTSGKRSRKS